MARGLQPRIRYRNRIVSFLLDRAVGERLKAEIGRAESAAEVATVAAVSVGASGCSGWLGLGAGS
jgi:hypothetical protein